jgi:hypothetical protein
MTMTDLEKCTEIENAVEALIDKYGLCPVVHGMSIVCSQKADHIRHNWQDNGLARQWDNAAKSIYRVTHSAVHAL